MNSKRTSIGCFTAEYAKSAEFFIYKSLLSAFSAHSAVNRGIAVLSIPDGITDALIAVKTLSVQDQ